MPMPAGGATYCVAGARTPTGADAAGAAGPGRRRHSGPFEVWTAPQFSRRSQLYWILDTGAGVAVLFMAVIVCLVGVGGHEPVADGRGGRFGARIRDAQRPGREPLRAEPGGHRAGLLDRRPGPGAGRSGQRGPARRGRGDGVPVAMSPTVGLSAAPAWSCVVALFSGFVAVRGVIARRPVDAAAMNARPPFHRPGAPSLQARQIRKSFLSGAVRVQVLHGCRSTCGPGELTLISGPVGLRQDDAGRSLSGLLQPDAGQVSAWARTSAPEPARSSTASAWTTAASSSRASTCSRR